MTTTLVAENSTDLLSYSLGDEKSKTDLQGLKLRCQPSRVPFRRLQGRTCLLPFPVPRGYLHPLACGPFQPSSHVTLASASFITSPSPDPAITPCDPPG